jgi:hypothetical protein
LRDFELNDDDDDRDEDDDDVDEFDEDDDESTIPDSYDCVLFDFLCFCYLFYFSLSLTGLGILNPFFLLSNYISFLSSPCFLGLNDANESFPELLLLLLPLLELEILVFLFLFGHSGPPLLCFYDFYLKVTLTLDAP